MGLCLAPGRSHQKKDPPCGSCRTRSSRSGVTASCSGPPYSHECQRRLVSTFGNNIWFVLVHVKLEETRSRDVLYIAVLDMDSISLAQYPLGLTRVHGARNVRRTREFTKWVLSLPGSEAASPGPLGLLPIPAVFWACV